MDTKTQKRIRIICLAVIALSLGLTFIPELPQTQSGTSFEMKVPEWWYVDYGISEPWIWAYGAESFDVLGSNNALNANTAQVPIGWPATRYYATNKAKTRGLLQVWGAAATFVFESEQPIKVTIRPELPIAIYARSGETLLYFNLFYAGMMIFIITR